MIVKILDNWKLGNMRLIKVYIEDYNKESIITYEKYPKESIVRKKEYSLNFIKETKYGDDK